MKTKLLAMMLLAGGSMFAQTRGSSGFGVEHNDRGYYQTASHVDSGYNEGYRSENRNREFDGRSTSRFEPDRDHDIRLQDTRNRHDDQNRRIIDDRDERRGFESH